MTIHDYTEQAVRKYLRTVLFVDDQLFESKCEDGTKQEDGNLSELTGMPDTSVADMSSPDQVVRDRQSGEASLNPQDEDGMSPSTDSFSVQDVIDGFYRSGIVCGLYQPKTSDFSNGVVPSSLVDLCDHSDVFILDWKLKNNQTDSPVPVLLKQLLDKDESIGAPRAVRFCAIYTDELLGTIFSKLHSEIFENSSDDSKKEDLQSFQMHLNGLTIRLYRKNNRSEADGSSTRFVPSSKLANKIIHDFTSEYEGILSATALHGIAKIRDNAKRILDKFPAALDYAFAIHSGLTISNPTIPEDLSSLLSNEIRSIVEDFAPSEDQIHEMLASRIEKIPETLFSDIATDSNLVVEGTTNAGVKRYFTDLFRCQSSDSPFKVSEVDCENHRIGLDFLEKLQTLALAATQKPNYAEGDLSKLFCQRTVYGNRRVLKPGTIVRESGSGSYYLCLMPLCDSVRLKHAKAIFPFWKLSQIQNVAETTESTGRTSSGRGTSHGLIVSEQDGTTKRLCLKGKIKDKMSLLQFKADDVVQFAKEGSSFFITECPRGNAGISSQQQNQTATIASTPKKFEWVAELKPLHAQRMAEYVSRQFSRVGVAESEWLRLQVDR